MNKKLMRKKLALMLANLKKKRKYYCECEYLESTGTQYIDTGVIPSNKKISAEVKFKLNGVFGSPSADTAGIIGSVKTDNTNNFQFSVFNGNWRTKINTFGSYNGNWDSNEHVIKLNTENGTILDNTVIISTQYTTPGENTVSLYLGAVNYNGSTVVSNNIYRLKGLLYYCKIYDNGTLVRDFIPVMGWDGKGYMYDKVSGQLFGNAGTGDFVMGRQIHPVEYLESTGTQYIDTGVNADSNLGFGVGFKWDTFNTANSRFLGVIKQDGGTYLRHHSSDSGSSFAYFVSNDITSIQGTVTTAFHSFSYNSMTKKFNFDGTEISAVSPAVFDIGLNFWLFGRNSNVESLKSYASVKLYSARLYNNGTLVRDFIPAISEDGTAFMFDRVSHTCYLNQGTGVFKSPAREIEYIESTGTQYINTGYNPNSNTKVEAKFKMNETANTFKWLFSSRNQALAGDGYGFGAVANGFIDSEYNSRVSSTTDKLTNGTVYTIVKDKNVCRYNDSVLTNPESTFTVNYPLSIFALNNIGTIEVSSYTKANCYYFKIYDNDILVRDFIPVFQDGVACMVDKLTGTAYTNQGTGSFSVGRIIEPEYE